ncbi:MAG: amidase, partial [Pseudomonadota bacterium]|nr:amidase [Pseudomonadota bacterium]
MLATDIVEGIRDGRVTARRIVEDCLAKIEADASLCAWAHLDAEAALAQADECDRLRQHGKP